MVEPPARVKSENGDDFKNSFEEKNFENSFGENFENDFGFSFYQDQTVESLFATDDNGPAEGSASLPIADDNNNSQVDVSFGFGTGYGHWKKFRNEKNWKKFRNPAFGVEVGVCLAMC